jgi:hypothetical protein
MLFKNSQDTTVGRIYKYNNLESSLKNTLLRSSLKNRTLGVAPVDQTKAVFVVGEETESEIPPFYHPFEINVDHTDYLVSDVRLFTNYTKAEYQDFDPVLFESSVRNRAEYNFHKLRAILSLQWLVGNEDQLLVNFKFVGNVYANWLSQQIGRTYALDPADQLKLAALFLYFYRLLHTRDTVLTGDLLDTSVTHSIKFTKFTARDLYTLYEKIIPSKNIEEFSSQIPELLENIRLKDFNFAILLNIIKNSWFATNAKDIIPIALEHPPTLISIVYSTLHEKSFKSSPLYKVIETSARGGNGDGFTQSIEQLFVQNSIKTESIVEFDHWTD